MFIDIIQQYKLIQRGREQKAGVLRKHLWIPTMCKAEWGENKIKSVLSLY
jgi:hypothetical protein